jgi:hypothetical protein
VLDLESMKDLYKIVHWYYPHEFAAKDGFGIVVDPKPMGCAWNSLIIGYLNWKTDDGYGNQEFSEYHDFKTLNEKDHIANWHFEHKPSKFTLDCIRYSIYLRHKRRLMDNLSLVEILDKLNEHIRRIS